MLTILVAICLPLAALAADEEVAPVAEQASSATDEGSEAETPVAEESADAETEVALPPKPAEADVLEEVLTSTAETTTEEVPAAESEAAEAVEVTSETPVAEEATEEITEAAVAEQSPSTEETTDEVPATAETTEETMVAEEAVEETPAAAETTEEATAVEESVGETSVEEPATDEIAVEAPEELDLPADVEAAMDEFMQEEVQPEGLRFVFRFQPWEDVLQWFADQADLSLIMDSVPTGTCNYTDNRVYTPAEAIDLINGLLLTKGYTLVRRERMLMVINLEDGIPEILIPAVPEEDLDSRGEFELVKVLFQLDKFEPEEAAAEIERLIGPQGAVVTLSKTKQLLVTETAGRLRMIQRVIRRVEDPEGLLSGKLESYQFANILPDEGLIVLRQLMGISAEANASDEGNFRFAIDPFGMRVLFSGSAEKVAQAKDILAAVDVSAGNDGDVVAIEALQLEVYPITRADPESVLKVMQTLMEGSPGARLSLDPLANTLVALARPSEHATIAATIRQMELVAKRIEVIYLRRLDPTLAAESIKTMFGEADEENTSAPSVEADSLNRQLVIYGTEPQIEQIRTLLGKMGETEFADGPVSTGSRIRVLPITGSSAETALRNLRMIWPTIRSNPIKEVTPSAIIPSLAPQETIRSLVPGKTEEEQLETPPQGGLPPVNIPGLYDAYAPPAKTPPAAAPQGEAAPDPQAARPGKGRFHFAVLVEETDEPAAVEESPSDQAPAAEAVAPQLQLEPQPQTPAPVEAPKPKSPIVISRGPNGLMIASDDLEALDEFEQLLNTMTGGGVGERTELTIFYLKHAKATTVAETLTTIIGSGTTGASASSDSILGQLVTSSIGDTMGALLNLGANALSPTGMLRITPEPRLNALIVEANATDLRTIEEVLKLLDQKESPEEILANARPRLIPVYNTGAEEIAELVKEVFAEEIQGAQGRSGGGGPSPEQIIAAMRGGRGGSSGSSKPREEVEKMTIGVDPRTNSLIVSAPMAVFEEVRILVEELDEIAGIAVDEDRKFVTINGNAEAMTAALQAAFGENIVVSSSSGSSGSSGGRGSTSSSRTGSSRRPTTGAPTSGISDDVRRRIEFMRSMMSGRGGAPGGGAPSGMRASGVRSGGYGGGGRPGGR